MNIVFLDTETTDIADGARLVQLAYKIPSTGVIVNEYFKPPTEISYGAMAIHHITNEMVADKPNFADSEHFSNLEKVLKENIVVAHNAPYDLAILKTEGLVTENYIDTLRVAKHMLVSEQYKLQYLRYSLHLNVEGMAHDALGDILVLEQLFNHLFGVVQDKFKTSSDEEVLEKMIMLTHEPVLMKSFSFGKHRGKTFAEVLEQDSSYLAWLYDSEGKKKLNEQNEELIYTLKYYLKIL